LRKGKLAEAEATLRKAAAANGLKKMLPSNFSELVAKVGDYVCFHFKSQEKEEIVSIHWKERCGNVLDGYARLMKTPKMRLRTLVIYFCWASISMICKTI
jgi:hypothetical protein